MYTVLYEREFLITEDFNTHVNKNNDPNSTQFTQFTYLHSSSENQLQCTLRKHDSPNDD